MSKILSDATANDILRMLRSRELPPQRKGGVFASNIAVIVRCDDATAIGTGWAEQFFPGTVVQVASDILYPATQALDIPSMLGMSVLLTVLGDSLGWVTPTLNKCYLGILTGDVEAETTTMLKGRPRVVAADAGGNGSSPLTTKGDLYGYDTANNRIPVGIDGQVLSVDSSVALGVKWDYTGCKTSVRVSTTAALPSSTYSGGFPNTITAGSNAAFPAQDGVTMALGDTVLIRHQTGALTANGKFTITQLGSGAAPWILTRSYDANSAASLSGMIVAVREGAKWKDTVWINTDDALFGTPTPKFQIVSPYHVEVVAGSGYNLVTGGVGPVGLQLSLPEAGVYDCHFRGDVNAVCTTNTFGFTTSLELDDTTAGIPGTFIPGTVCWGPYYPATVTQATMSYNIFKQITATGPMLVDMIWNGGGAGTPTFTFGTINGNGGIAYYKKVK